MNEFNPKITLGAKTEVSLRRKNFLKKEKFDLRTEH
jgi:hypothetical protein